MVEANMVNAEHGLNRVNAAEFAAKFRSKKEVYDFLTVDARAYLCDASCLTIYFLKDLVTGQKKCKQFDLHINSVVIKDQGIKHLACPHYEGLSIEEILKKIQQYPEVSEYLPEERDIRRLPRQWLVNVAFTVIGDAFSHWVKEKVNLRHSKIIQDKKLGIELDPEIAQAFHNSSSISTTNGIGVHMLKPGSKRRRTKQQILEQKNFQELAHEQINEQGQEIEALKQQLQASREEAENNRAAADILNEMIGRGDVEVNPDGSVQVSKKKVDLPNFIGNIDDQ